MNEDISFGGWKFTRGRLKYAVNEKFFDTWSPQMAYVVGFTYADGSTHRTSLSWQLQSRDRNILEKIKKAMDCSYPITTQRNNAACRLRISNQVLLGGVSRLGLMPKKKFRNAIPKIPLEVLRHFIRGFLDGDGWIVLREGRTELDVGFCGGNEKFLSSLNSAISQALEIKPGKVRRKVKTTAKLKQSVTYQLEFYSGKAFKIARWIYDNLSTSDLYLERKYEKYLKANKLYTFLASGTKKIRIVQRKHGKNIKEILSELHAQKGLDGVQIAKVLGVHYSSIYRWLAQTEIKYPVPRIVKTHG